MKKNKLVQIVFSVLLFLHSCGILETENQNPTYEEQKMSIGETEKNNPHQFLSTNGTYRRNLLDEIVIEGTIENRASVTTYKDFIIRIRFFSKTGSQIGIEDRIVYEFVRPYETINFKIKTDGYRDTKTVNWEIHKATPVNN